MKNFLYCCLFFIIVILFFTVPAAAAENVLLTDIHSSDNNFKNAAVGNKIETHYGIGYEQRMELLNKQTHTSIERLETSNAKVERMLRPVRPQRPVRPYRPQRPIRPGH